MIYQFLQIYNQSHFCKEKKSTELFLYVFLRILEIYPLLSQIDFIVLKQQNTNLSCFCCP